MRIFICLVCLIFFNATLAEDEKTEITVIEVETPALDQPITQDIGGRLDRVEKTLDNMALLDMLDLLESLKTEVSTLRGQVEVQTHTIEQLKQKQRDLYTDIDRRLQRIDPNKPTATTSPDLDTLDSTANQFGATDVKPTGEQGLVVETSSELTNNTDASNDEEMVDPLKAEVVYQRAFKLLKESQYDQAQKAFKDFLKDYPDSAFSDNAQYWIGEANYVMQKYELAINEYQALLNTFPNSKKVSHALLKIGYSYAELGNAADATKTLNKVKSQYPGTTAARLADERLRKIGADKETNT